MDALERLKNAKCCACKGPIGDRINVVQLSKRAAWEHPICTNVVSGYGPCATAVVCDRCVGEPGSPMAPIRFAIEFRESAILYHEADLLEDLGPEPTFFISRDGQSIQCLVCGRTSRHPRDVQEKYCASCKAFHPIGAS